MDNITTYGNVAYSYNRVGNRTDLTNPTTGHTTYGYNQANQLTEQVNGADTTNLTYDANGALTQKARGTDITDYSYNGMDKLTGVVTPSSTVNYGYDALGRRISRSEGSSTTNYHHSAKSDLTDYETDSSGALASSFNRGADGLISETDYSGTPTTSYHLYNAHGDTSTLSDQNGSVTGSYRYDSFGNPISGSPPENGYTGKWQREKDSSTGNIRMGVREYDPEVGRFVSADSLKGNPTDPLQRNRYNFVWANPLNHYDITGYSMDFWNSMLFGYSDASQTSEADENYDEPESNRFGADQNGYTACTASLDMEGMEARLAQLEAEIAEASALEQLTHQYPKPGDVGAWWEKEVFDPTLVGAARTSARYYPAFIVIGVLYDELFGEGTAKAY